ncbi:hypothetical protein D3C85_956010 [compost metagenome]
MRALRRLRRFFLLARVLHTVVPHAHRAPAVVPVLAGMAGQVEGHAGNEARVVAFHSRHAGVAAQSQQTALRERLARFVDLVTSGVVIALVALTLMIQVRRDR